MTPEDEFQPPVADLDELSKEMFLLQRAQNAAAKYRLYSNALGFVPVQPCKMRLDETNVLALEFISSAAEKIYDIQALKMV